MPVFNHLATNNKITKQRVAEAVALVRSSATKHPFSPFMRRNLPLVSTSEELRLRRKCAADVVRDLARPVIHTARALPVWAQVMVSSRKSGPLVAFLPAYGRHGAALLRIYNIAKALKGQGWQSVILPSTLTLEQRQCLLAALKADVVVMQGARHVLNRPDLYDAPVVFDMDDADFHLPHLAEPVARAMEQVAGVIAGSRYVAQWCEGRGAHADVVWTASPVSLARRRPHSARAPVVAWAQTVPVSYKAEADWVLDVMAHVSRRCPQVRLRLYDRVGSEGDAFLARFQQAGITTEWVERAKYSDYLKTFDDVSLALAPLCPQSPFSRGKSFGKVLAYLDCQVPVIASDACEQSVFFTEPEDVLSNDYDVWVSEISRLLAAPAERALMAQSAHARFQKRLSLKQAGRRVDRILRKYIT